MTGYNLFVKDNFDKYKTEGSATKDVISQLGGEWKALGAEEREEYIGRAAAMPKTPRKAKKIKKVTAGAL